MANKYQGKTKGVKYIAQRLTKYFPKKFNNYTSALPEARLVLDQINKNNNGKVNLKNIFSKVRVSRVSKSKALQNLKDDPRWKSMLPRIPYYEIGERGYEVDIALLSDKIFFRSKIFPILDKKIQGGKTYTYHELFKPFVDFCDEQRAKTGEGSDRYEVDWFVKFTELRPDPQNKGFYYSEFISIDRDGGDNDFFDYGFKPESPKSSPENPVLSEAEPLTENEKNEEVKVKKTTTSATEDKEALKLKKEIAQIELEKLKEPRLLIQEKLKYAKELKKLGYSEKEIRSELNKF